ncbi:MAG TPA: hypothetical protein VL652_34695 [Kutzneria sp.]|jgi:hypothetical protein|nr:hypothetical protein [Kutzneria sp.]
MRAGQKLTRRDVANLAVLAIFGIALGYLIYLAGWGAVALVPVLGVAALIGLVIAALRRHTTR